MALRKPNPRLASSTSLAFQQQRFVFKPSGHFSRLAALDRCTYPNLKVVSKRAVVASGLMEYIAVSLILSPYCRAFSELPASKLDMLTLTFIRLPSFLYSSTCVNLCKCVHREAVHFRLRGRLEPIGLRLGSLRCIPLTLNVGICAETNNTLLSRKTCVIWTPGLSYPLAATKSFRRLLDVCPYKHNRMAKHQVVDYRIFCVRQEYSSCCVVTWQEHSSSVPVL